jgi:serine phosphatase RsbU (regulator of sigma subunit)
VGDDKVEEIARAGPVLGAFPDAEWSLDHAVIEPGGLVVVVTDGIAEAGGPGRRFGEERVRSELAGATGPTPAVQRLEGALGSFAGAELDDDVAILALAPASVDAAGRDLEIGLSRNDPAGFGAQRG